MKKCNAKLFLVTLIFNVMICTTATAQVKFGLQAGVNFGRDFYPISFPGNNAKKIYGLSANPLVLASVRFGKKDYKFINELGYSMQRVAFLQSSLGDVFKLPRNGLLLKSQLEYRVVPNTGITLGAYGNFVRYQNTRVASFLKPGQYYGYTIGVNQYFKKVFLQLAYQRSLWSNDKVSFTDDDGNVIETYTSLSRHLQLSVGYLF